MSTTSDFRPGLEGVVAFETEIAEPDRDGGALRYRGIDIEDLANRQPCGLFTESGQVPRDLPHERQEHRLQREVTPREVERRCEDEHAATSSVALDERGLAGVEARQHARIF